MKRITPLIGSLLLICLFVLPSQAVDKRPLTHDDNAAWKSIAGQGISVNGEWIYYIESPQDGDAQVVAVHAKKGTTYRHVIGYSGVGTTAHRSASPGFTYDSKYLIFMAA